MFSGKDRQKPCNVACSCFGEKTVQVHNATEGCSPSPYNHLFDNVNVPGVLKDKDRHNRTYKLKKDSQQTHLYRGKQASIRDVSPSVSAGVHKFNKK